VSSSGDACRTGPAPGLGTVPLARRSFPAAASRRSASSSWPDGREGGEGPAVRRPARDPSRAPFRRRPPGGVFAQLVLDLSDADCPHEVNVATEATTARLERAPPCRRREGLSRSFSRSGEDQRRRARPLHGSTRSIPSIRVIPPIRIHEHVRVDQDHRRDFRDRGDGGSKSWERGTDSRSISSGVPTGRASRLSASTALCRSSVGTKPYWASQASRTR